MVFEDHPGIFQVAINVDGEWWIDEIIAEWMLVLKRNYMSSYNSRRTYANALNIFLHYYIYSPQKKNQSLFDYLLDFREKLHTGLEITTERVINTGRINFTMHYTVLKKKSLKKSTVNTYMTGIQWFLSFLKEKRVDANVESLHSDEIDWYQLKQQSILGKGGGYGLMMSPLLAQLIGPKKKLIKNYSLGRDSSKLNTYFPPEAFLDLLKISNPREQAIYLLCACAGARIGQALSLTRDDYDVECQIIYLIDPKSDETGPRGKQGRFQLLQEYGINIEETPYKYVASKYPIPLQYEELLWIAPIFKKMFFKALAQIDKGNHHINNHPFIFITKSGKILTPSECYTTFRSKIKKLQKNIQDEWDNQCQNTDRKNLEELNKNYLYLLNQLNETEGLHSLRHTYGIMWADFSVINPNLTIQKAELLCQYGMGHKSKKSVLSYFTLRAKAREHMYEGVMKPTEIGKGLMDYWNTRFKSVDKYFERNA